jgi:hypothetical protein
LKGEKKIHRCEIKSSDMEIDGIHVSKRPKLSQDKEVITKSYDDCMIVDSVPESVTPVPTFKVEHFSSDTMSSGK